MISPIHIAETALLILAAYLIGCACGYAARRLLHAGLGSRQLAPQQAPLQPVAAAPEPRRPRSHAARLAASVDDLPPSAVPVATAPAVAKAPAAPTKLSPANPGVQPKPNDPRPASLPGPRNGSADKLTQIKGIGPKIEASLHAMGVYHFDQIVGWSNDNIDWVDAQLAFKGRIRRERWVEQATELSKATATV